jgi:hypothetical protein
MTKPKTKKQTKVAQTAPRSKKAKPKAESVSVKSTDVFEIAGFLDLNFASRVYLSKWYIEKSFSFLKKSITILFTGKTYF